VVQIDVLFNSETIKIIGDIDLLANAK